MSSNCNLYHPVQILSLSLPGNIFLAPVAGYSDRAFRSLCISCGASFTYTEMVSSEALTRNSEKTETIMLRAPNEENYAVQLFGSDPIRMKDAARITIEQTHCECIDINAGCPVPKIIKTGAGATLTRYPEKLFSIVEQTIKGTKEACEKDIPVTVKIRSGWDEKTISWKEAALASLEAGVAAITLHPRTRAQGYEGTSNWEYLADLTSLIKKTHPTVSVFGSGDLFSPEAARDMLETTKCDGVMFARGAIGNPFIFTQTKDLLTKGFYEQIPITIRLHAGWNELLQLCEDKGEGTACREMRKRFCAYSKGAEGGAHLRSDIIQCATIEDYKKVMENHGFCEVFQRMSL